MAVYTEAWTILDPTKQVQGILSSSTTRHHPLGTRVRAVETANDNGEGEFIYLAGVASGVFNAWVTYTLDDGACVLLAQNAIGPVGIMKAALSAATVFGWVQIFGKAVGLAAAGYADNGLVYATATPGTADDAVVAGDRVKNALGASALDAPKVGSAEFEIQYPWMDDATAA